MILEVVKNRWVGEAYSKKHTKDLVLENVVCHAYGQSGKTDDYTCS